VFLESKKKIAQNIIINALVDISTPSAINTSTTLTTTYLESSTSELTFLNEGVFLIKINTTIKL